MRWMRPAALMAALALTALTAACSTSTSGRAGTVAPPAPAAVTAADSGATVTSCRLEGGFVVARGTIVGRQPGTSDYTLHLQVVQDGVRVDDVYAAAAKVPQGRTGRFVGSGTGHPLGSGFRCDVLDVTWRASR